MATASLTPEKLIIADLIIKRMQYGQPSIISGGFWYSLLNDKYNELGADNFNKANQILQEGNYQEIINFLMEQDYIEIVNYAIPNYILKPKGKEAKDKGGHTAYVNWQKEQAVLAAAEAERNKKDQQKINWPQKYWWLVALLVMAGTKIVDLSFDYYKSKKSAEKSTPVLQPAKSSIKMKDTSAIHNSDTLATNIKK